MDARVVSMSMPVPDIGSLFSTRPRLLSFRYLPPDENKQNDVLEYIKERGREAPTKKPGDGYTFCGAVIGIIIGIFIGFYFRMPWVYIVGVVGGGIAGTLTGSIIGARIVENADRKDKLGFS